MTDKPDKKDSRARLAELLGTDSTNFLGTGLTMREFLQLGQAEKMAAAWCLQPPEEQKRRRRAVIQLSIELGRIQEITNFSTRLAELAIESVIEGDWKMVEEWADHFTFSDESDDLRQTSAPTFAVFRELLLQVLRTDKELPA
jgi:hypothetical protein